MRGSSRGLESGSTKGGRDSSHSYWSRTHGPRGTTHGTSGRRPWLWMVSQRGFLLPAGCRVASPGSPDLETAAAAVQRGVREKEIDIRGFHPRAKYRRRGALGYPPVSQEASWRDLGWGRAKD